MQRAVIMRTHWTRKLMGLEVTLMPAIWFQVQLKQTAWESVRCAGAQWVCQRLALIIKPLPPDKVD